MFRFLTWILLRPSFCIILPISFLLCSLFCVTYIITFCPHLCLSPSWDNSTYFMCWIFSLIFSLLILKMFRSNRILLFTNLSSDIFFLKYYVTLYFSFSVSWFFLLYYLEISSQLLLFTDIHLPNPIPSWNWTSCPRRNREKSSISGYFILREPGFERNIQTRLACTWRIFLYVQILEFSDLLPELASRFKDVLSKCPSGWWWRWRRGRADSARRVARGLPLTYSHVSKHNSVKLLIHSGNYVYHYFNISKTLHFTQTVNSYAFLRFLE